MTKDIIKITGILAAIVVLFFAVRNISFAPVVEVSPTGKNEENNIEKVKIDPNIPGMTLPLSNDPKDVAWALFQKYLGYNKIQDLDGVRSTVYKVASVCDDPKTTIDCKARMSLAYQYGSALKKEDFVNVWSDEKQIILSTDFKTEENVDTLRRTRSIIFFVIDDTGDIRMLSFSPFKGAITSKGAASKEEFDYRILRYTEDKDKDGAMDYHEECLDAKEGEACTKTNPKVRDTDGDGWWDGVEALGALF